MKEPSANQAEFKVYESDGGAMGPHYTIKRGDLWVGHLYEDAARSQDFRDLLTLINGEPL